MNPFKFIKQNLLYFRQKNVFLALGIAISATVITGSLIVGDSIRYSLSSIVEHRLGKITHIVKYGDRYFSSDLAPKLSEFLKVKTANALLTDGIGINPLNQTRIGNIQVLGVDASFDTMAGLNNYYSQLSGDEVILSSNMAGKLGLKAGEEILLRLSKTSLIPLNAPFVSDKENVVSVRLRILAIAGTKEMGRFNLKNSQTAPYNAFVSHKKLCELMDFSGKANLIFIAANDELSTDSISEGIHQNWSLSDAGLKLEFLNELSEYNLTSERVFIDDYTGTAILQSDDLKFPVFTYFVNSLKANGYTTPYSFVSTTSDPNLSEDDLIVNNWLARDLGALPDDSLELEYFIVGPLRELEVKKKKFRIKTVVPMEGHFRDEKLMPDLPGLSDAGNCRDWETGIPVQLEKIRDKDEDYWKQYKGTPKAFVSIITAQNLWKNRFGKYTAFRFSAESISEDSLSRNVMSKLTPESLGFKIEEVRVQGETASRHGVDFSQLFAGLSFFLLAGGIVLTVLLFLMNIESRNEQIATLSAIGIPMIKIRRLFLSEGMIISFFGAVTGLILAVLYSKLVFSALNGIWSDIVRTDMLLVDIRLKALITGLVITLMISWFSMFLPLHIFLKRKFLRLQKRENPGNNRKIPLVVAVVTAIFGSTGIILIAAQLFRGELTNHLVFFLAGGLILFSGISGFFFILKRPLKYSKKEMSLRDLGLKSLIRNPTRSLSIVILFALGSFLVVSTGSNRKNLFTNSEQKSSGTGGFLYYANSTAPILRNLNDPEIQYEYGFTNSYRFFQLRVSDGDDASCLNLNRIVNPSILGINPSDFKDRFSFATRTPYLDEVDPWSSLDKELPGDLIPAIADETVIKWGLGLKVGDTLLYKDSRGENLELLLIGGLTPSIFQGNVIISDKYFLKSYPESSGTKLILIEGNIVDTSLIMEETSMGLRDFGWDIGLTSVRLAEFNSVTNTYLSIFMVMGALGLLLGTIGLAIVLFRSITERKNEIALLRAIGFSKKSIRNLIVVEYMALLFAGVGIGFLTSVISTLPSLINPESGTSLAGIALIFFSLLLNGWFWTYLIANHSLRNESLYEALRTE